MKFIRLGVRVFELLLLSVGVFFFWCQITNIDAYIVLSGSMNPTIETGSIVLVDNAEKDYVIGDVVTYRIADQLITHRIVEIQKDLYRTKGDANMLPDSVFIHKNQILGKVIYEIPKIGYVISHFKSKSNIFIILSILLLSNLSDVLSEHYSKKTKKI